MPPLLFVIGKERTMKNEKNRPLGVKEIAAELGCCQQTVRRYHAAGVLPTQQIGGKWSSIKMSRVDLVKWIRKQKRERRG